MFEPPKVAVPAAGGDEYTPSTLLFQTGRNLTVAVAAAQKVLDDARVGQISVQGLYLPHDILRVFPVRLTGDSLRGAQPDVVRAAGDCRSVGIVYWMGGEGTITAPYGDYGKAKAVTATGRKIATLFYNLLKHGARYQDPGADFYEERYRQKVVRNLQRKAHDLGYELVKAPEPGA